MIEVLDPTHEEAAALFAAADRTPSLDGAVVGIVSNGKQGTRAFFAALADELVERWGAAEVVVEVKSNYSAPADTEIMDRTTAWSAVISGIGD